MRQEIDREHCLDKLSYESFYQTQARNREQDYLRKGSRMKPTNWAIREILNNRSAPCEVLDVGCQYGSTGLILAALWYNVWAIDVSEIYIEKSERNTEAVNDWIQYSHMRIEEASKLGKMFDIITCLSVLEHVQDFDKAWDSMLSVAENGALILSVVPIGESWLSEEHTRIFTDDNIYDYFPKGSVVSGLKFSDQLGWYAIKYIKGVL